MKNYKFIQDYNTTITVGGIIGLQNALYGKGTILQSVEENDKNVTLRIKPEPTGMFGGINRDNMAYQTTIVVPKSYVQQTNEPVNDIRSIPEKENLINIQDQNTNQLVSEDVFDESIYLPVKLIFATTIIVITGIFISLIISNDKNN